MLCRYRGRQDRRLARGLATARRTWHHVAGVPSPVGRRRPSPSTTVEDFERRMELLAQAEVHGNAGRWIITPRKGVRFVGSAERKRARARERRKQVFVFLLESIGITFLIGGPAAACRVDRVGRTRRVSAPDVWALLVIKGAADGRGATARDSCAPTHRRAAAGDRVRPARRRVRVGLVPTARARPSATLPIPGGVAHVRVEHCVRNAGVRGSSPLTSTDPLGRRRAVVVALSTDRGKSSPTLTGLDTYPSKPAARNRSPSPRIAWAVTASTGIAAVRSFVRSRRSA